MSAERKPWSVFGKVRRFATRDEADAYARSLTGDWYVVYDEPLTAREASALCEMGATRSGRSMFSGRISAARLKMLRGLKKRGLAESLWMDELLWRRTSEGTVALNAHNARRRQKTAAKGAASHG